MKNKIFNIVRIVISLSLITYLVFKYKDNIAGFIAATTIKDINFLFLFLAAFMHVTGVLISAVRWKILLKLQNIDVNLNYLNGSLLVGIFLNNFLPSSIGGDTYRAYDSSKLKNSSWVKSISVILVERGTGVIALLSFAFISLILGIRFTDYNEIFIIVIVMLVIALLFLIVLLKPNLIKPLRFIFKIKFLEKIKNKIRSMADAFLAFKNKKVLFYVIMWSFIMEFNVIVHYYLASLALNIEVSFISFIFMVPIVLFIAMIPISIGGLGVRENTTVYLLATLGIASGEAAAFSLLILIQLFLVSIIGGIILFIRRPKIFSPQP